MKIKNIGKAFAPRIINKVIQTFDRAMIMVVGTAWAVALLMILFALYTINLTVAAKKEFVTAAAGEPSLPNVVSAPPGAAETQPLVDRLQKRFPEIGFVLTGGQSLTVTAVDPSKFRLWLTVLSYIDTISPQYRWSIQDLCVGSKCGGNVPMRAVVVAEKITFSNDAPAN